MKPLHALTALRGVAAWWVVLYHVREFFPPGTPALLHSVAAKGYLAVDLFFELSGFVIALNYGSGTVNWRVRDAIHFLGLRFSRIYPLHLFMMVVFLANPIALRFFSGQHLIPDRYSPDYYWASLLLVQNWGVSDALKWNIPAWSISTEWAAYLLFPLLSLRIASLRARGALLVAATLIVGLMIQPLATGTNLGSDIPGFGLVRCLCEFNLGVCLCCLYRAYPPRTRRRSGIAGATALAFCATYACLSVPDYAVMPVSLLLLIYTLTDQDCFLSRGMQPRFLVYVGAISYSTYLVHYFVKDWCKFLLADKGLPSGMLLMIYLFVTAVGSMLLYRFVERPGQDIARRWMRRKARSWPQVQHP